MKGDGVVRVVDIDEGFDVCVYEKIPFFWRGLGLTTTLILWVIK